MKLCKFLHVNQVNKKIVSCLFTFLQMVVQLIFQPNVLDGECLWSHPLTFIQLSKKRRKRKWIALFQENTGVTLELTEKKMVTPKVPTKISWKNGLLLKKSPQKYLVKKTHAAKKYYYLLILACIICTVKSINQLNLDLLLKI